MSTPFSLKNADYSPWSDIILQILNVLYVADSEKCGILSKMILRTLFVLCSLSNVQCSITNSFIMQNWFTDQNAFPFCHECPCWVLDSLYWDYDCFIHRILFKLVNKISQLTRISALRSKTVHTPPNQKKKQTCRNKTDHPLKQGHMKHCKLGVQLTNHVGPFRVTHEVLCLQPAI